ncbi:MAG: hypothetical protein LAP39_21685 [Acidobacteriia bacterium]|nr:hypothetical protein [Terriglobia bacterium]
MEPAEQCPEREILLREWTQRGRRLINLLDEHLAALKNTDQATVDFDEEISLAKRSENEACHAYYDHVDSHDCV